MAHLATRRSGKLFAAGDLTLTVVSGAPVTVFGIWLSNTTGATTAFTINDGAGNLIDTVEVIDETTLELSTQWLADAGIQIVGIAATSAQVFHNNAGR